MFSVKKIFNEINRIEWGLVIKYCLEPDWSGNLGNFLQVFLQIFMNGMPKMVFKYISFLFFMEWFKAKNPILLIIDQNQVE